MRADQSTSLYSLTLLLTSPCFYRNGVPITVAECSRCSLLCFPRRHAVSLRASSKGGFFHALVKQTRSDGLESHGRNAHRVGWSGSRSMSFPPSTHSLAGGRAWPGCCLISLSLFSSFVLTSLLVYADVHTAHLHALPQVDGKHACRARRSGPTWLPGDWRSPFFLLFLRG